MRLTYEVDYEDYSDKEHWLPRKQALEQFVAGIQPGQIRGTSDTQLLTTMELVEELMRYYTAVKDYGRLEPVMRLQDALIREGQARGLSEVGFCYEEMVFQRVNALLYNAEGQDREAAAYYSEVCDLAAECWQEMWRDGSLSDKQILYVGWGCIEGVRESSRVQLNLGNTQETLQQGWQAIEMLDRIHPYTLDMPGIESKVADYYASFAGYLYQNGGPAQGRACYENAVQIYRDMDRRRRSDFYYAQALWTMSLYGMQEIVVNSDARVMQNCLQEIEVALDERLRDDREIAIAEAARATAQQAQAAGMGQNGDVNGAIRILHRVIAVYEDSRAVLERNMQGQGDYYRSVISDMVCKIHISHISALNTLGTLQFGNEDNEGAKESFEEALRLLDGDSGYEVGAYVAILVRADCMKFMAILSAGEDDVDAAVFYGEQALELLNAHASFEPQGLVLHTRSACYLFMTELYLAMRNKPKALEYAQEGLEIMQRLRRVAPEFYSSEAEAALERMRKKASRRFL